MENLISLLSVLNPQGSMTDKQIAGTNMFDPIGGKQELSDDDIKQILGLKKRDQNDAAMQAQGNKLGMAHAQGKDVTGQAASELGQMMGMVGRRQRAPQQFDPMDVPIHPGILQLLGA